MEEDNNIKTLEVLNQVLTDLKEKKEFIINIPNVNATEIIKIFKSHKLKHSHVGFKRWKISPSTGSVKEIDKGVIILAFRTLL